MERQPSFTAALVPPGPRRLLTKIIDHNAAFHPTKIYASFPRTESITDGFRELSYKDFANAINRAAWWLDKTLGKAMDFDIFAYYGPRDIRYSVLTVAAIKTGRKILLPSSDIFKARLASFMSYAGCSVLILGPTEFSMPLIDLALVTRRFAVPGLEEMLDMEMVPQYPYDKTFQEAKDDPFMVLHTSCADGLPAPITYTNGHVATWDAQRHMPEDDGLMWWRLLPGKRLHSSMELDISRVFSCLIFPVLFDATIVLGPGDQPLTLSILNCIYELGAVDGGLYMPPILEKACKSPITLQKIKKLEFIICTGGTLSRAAADILANITKLHNMLATNMLGVLPVYLQKPSDYLCFRFHPWLGYEMRPVRIGRFALDIRRVPQLAAFQGVFIHNPTATVYNLRKIFEPHPKQNNLWVYVGPTGATITFSHGGELDPTDMEAIICEDSLVSAAIIGGNGKDKPFLLLELAADLEDMREMVLDRLWPAIEEANKTCCEYAQLTRPMIMFTSPGYPLRRTVPGTSYVDRFSSIGDYIDDINELYNEVYKSK